jgi:dTDP-4-amino-4,6-dideoxygalactose transaminase
VAAVVRRGWVAPGPEVDAFERELAGRLATEAVAVVSSGSMALELALRALQVGPGHEVVIPTYVCDALHHAVVRAGATPVLADADPATLSLSAATVRVRLSPRTRAVIVPHAFGLAADLRPLLALGVPIVEDCAQTLGARLDERPVGSLGTLAVCSFYATKMLTTGEGGAVAGPAALVERVRDLRDYDERDDLTPRVNAKLSDLAAALGRSQLARLDTFVARRRAVADRYRQRLRGAPCATPPEAGGRHVYHRFVVEVDRSPDDVRAALHARGVAARRPVYRPAHRALGLGGFPEADRLWERALSLPCYPSLTEAEVDTVVGALREVLA